MKVVLHDSIQVPDFSICLSITQLKECEKIRAAS
jgi:hypothetical protein